MSNEQAMFKSVGMARSVIMTEKTSTLPMKKLFFILSVLSLTSCTITYIQVMETQAPKLKVIDNRYVFENDTVKITYAFWADKGVMSFSIYNKTETPFYIDWKNSSFIYNNNKLDYWLDMPQWSWPGVYEKYLIRGPLAPRYRPVGIQDPLNQQQKNERLTFIPPHSYSHHFKFYLLPVEYFQMDKARTLQTEVVRSDKPEKQTTILEEKFDSSSTPLAFRNFIAIKFSENSEQLYFYDNEFYLSSVKKMDIRHFRGKSVSFDPFLGPLYQSIYESNTSFYIEPSYFGPGYYRGPY
jgi:hypothetical protein